MKLVGNRARPLAVALLLGSTAMAGGLLVSAPAHAQSEQARAFDIPAQPLGLALAAFSQQSAIDIAYGADIPDVRAPAVTGRFSSAEALSRLLTGSGLTFRFTGATSVALQPAPPASGAVQLGPVRVEGGVSAARSPDVRERRRVHAEEAANTYTVSESTSSTRLELALKDTPQSISVITQGQIEDQNLFQTVDILDQAPGIVIAEYGAPGAGRVRYYSRGFEIEQIQLDGMPATAGGVGLDVIAALDTAIFETVDIVRGSTGLMTGVGDPSASVNLRRKRPTDTFQLSGNAAYGSWNRLRAEFDVSGPITGDGRLRGRLVGAYQSGDHWMDRLNTNSKMLYGALEYDLSDQTQVNVGAVYYDMHADAAAPFGARTGDLVGGWDWALYPNSRQDRHYNPATDWSYIDTNVFNAFAQLEHRFSDDWRANFHYGYTDLKNERMWGVLGGNVYYEDEGWAGLGWGHTSTPSTIHSLDGYVNGKFRLLGREHDIVAGFNYYRGYMNSPGYGGSEGLPLTRIELVDWNNGNIPVPRLYTGLGISAEQLGIDPAAFEMIDNMIMFKLNERRVREMQWGGYLSARLRPLNGVSLILGTRYTQWKQHTQIAWASTSPLFDNPPNFDLVYDDVQTNAPLDAGKPRFVPYAGLVVEVTPSLSAYASYTSIYRPNSSTMSDFGWIIVSDFEGNPLKPVEGASYEIGLKAGLYDNRLNLHLALFRMNQENEINGINQCPAREGDNAPVGLIMCASEYRRGDVVRGAEFTFSGAITDRWQVSGGYTYLDIYNSRTAGIRFQDGTTSPSKVSYNADYQRPRHLFKLMTSYRPTYQLMLGGSLVWRSTVDYDTNNGGYAHNRPEPNETELAYLRAMRQPAHAVVGLFARYQFHDRFTLGMNVENLFDKTYKSNENGNYYGAPRNVMFSLRYRM